MIRVLHWLIWFVIDCTSQSMELIDGKGLHPVVWSRRGEGVLGGRKHKLQRRQDFTTFFVFEPYWGTYFLSLLLRSLYLKTETKQPDSPVDTLLNLTEQHLLLWIFDFTQCFFLSIIDSPDSFYIQLLYRNISLHFRIFFSVTQGMKSELSQEPIHLNQDLPYFPHYKAIRSIRHTVNKWPIKNSFHI